MSVGDKMKEIELKSAVQKAIRADELLNDPLIQEFIVAIRGDLLNKFESTDLSNDAERMDAWRKSQVLNMFLDKFRKTIRDGKNARIKLLDRAKNLVNNR